jgi:gas vesicle protein
MTRALCAALLFLAAASPCRAEDEWFGGDKRAHFLGGLVVGGAFSAATGSHHPGVLMGCGVGVFGELIEAAIDRGFTPRVSAKDFAAECAGGVVGAWVGVKLAKDSQVQESKAARSSTDSWTSGDKRAHFLGGLAISGVVSHLTDSATAGVLSGCGAAVAGELIDAAANKGWNNKHVSAKDFAAGCLGAVVGGFAGVYIAPNRIVWSRQF